MTIHTEHNKGARGCDGGKPKMAQLRQFPISYILTMVKPLNCRLVPSRVPWSISKWCRAKHDPSHWTQWRC